MHEKAANELFCAEGHIFDRIVVIAIPIPDGDLIPLHVDHSVIGNGDPVGVSPQIVHDGFCIGERAFAVDDPFLLIQIAEEVMERSILLQVVDLPGEF